jgi:hypothetical protein
MKPFKTTKHSEERPTRTCANVDISHGDQMYFRERMGRMAGRQKRLWTLEGAIVDTTAI